MDDLLTSLESRVGVNTTGVVPESSPVSSDGAAPTDPAAVDEIRARRDSPKRGPGRPRKEGEPAKSHKKKVAEPLPVTPTLDPATREAMKPSLVEAYQLALSLLAFAPILFTDDEKPVVGEGLMFCVETYLPDGFSKHAPAFVLVAVSLQAVVRARQESGQAAKDGKDKKK